MDSSDFGVTVSPVVDGVVLVRVRGELDGAAAPQLVTAVKEAIGGGCGAVHLDLSGLAFLDSAGLSALLGMHRDWSDHDTTIVVVKASEPVRRLFDLTGVMRLLTGPDGLPGPNGG